MVTILVMEVRQTLWSVFQFPSCWQVMEKPVHKSHTFSKFCELYHVNENDRKRMLGHSFGNDVTNRVYGHRDLKDLKMEIEKIDKEYFVTLL